jgi:hypothetical protein
VRSGGLAVQLSDAANGNVIADAVRLQWLRPLPQGPVVQVLDGGTNVPDGTGAVSLGSTFVGAAVIKTFTVKNLGTQPLVLTGPLSVPAGFSVAAGFGVTTVAPGASTTFTLRLDAAAAGGYGGQVSFGTNDPNNNPFTFSVSGTVAAAGIIDDSSPAGFTTAGSWQVWTNSGYLGNVHEATGRTGADVASWAFAGLAPGQYRVSVTWAAWPDRATNAPYTVLDGGALLATVPVNQQVAPAGLSDAGGTWQDLGSFQVRSGGLAVQLSDAANGNVIADAVRLQWLAPLPPGPAIVASTTGPVSNGKGSVGLGNAFAGISPTRRLTVGDLGAPIPVPGGAPDPSSQQPVVIPSPSADGDLAVSTVFSLPRKIANRRSPELDQSATQSDGLAGT